MFKKKLKVMAGTLLAVVLISQLAIPYSLTFAFAAQSTKDSVSQPTSNTSNNPLVSTTEKDKINLEPKSELKPKPKNELIGDNQPLRVKPLTQPKSEGRAASTEKKWKHVVRTKLPDEVGYSYESKEYKLSGLKPNSAIEIKTNYEKDRLIIKTANNLGEVSITYQDLNREGYVYKRINREDIIYFEGDIPDNEPPKEEKIGYYNLSVLSGIGRNNSASLSPMIAGVFIEACDESGKVIGSGVTNKDGECILSLKVPMKIQKIKIRQNKEKSPTTVENFNIQYDTVEKEYNIFPRPIRTKLVDKQIAFYNKEKPETTNTHEEIPSGHMTTSPEFLNNGLYNFCVTVYLDSDRLGGVPIELLDYKNDIVASVKTNDKFGTAAFNIPLALGKNNFKMRMNKEFLSSFEKEGHKNIYWDTKEKNIAFTVEMCQLDNGRKEPAVTSIDMHGEDDDFDNSNSLLAFRNFTFTETIKPEQKEYTITVQSIATKEGQPDRSLYDIPIEIYRNDGALIVSGKTSDDGAFKAKIKAFSGEKIKIKQIIDEASRNLDVELDPNEKIISMGASTADSVVIFSNKDKLDTSDCYVKFNFQFPPNANVSFDACKFNFAYDVPDQLNAIFIYTSPHNFTMLLINDSRTPIKRSQATNFMVVNTPKFPPGYYVESINGVDPKTTFPNVPKEVTVKIGYKATGEFNYSARIEIPNEKYKGCFEAGLLDEKGYTVVSAVNDEKGNFNFEKIKYTEKDVGKHKYQTYIKPTEKGAKLKGALGGIKFYGAPNSSLYDEGFPFYITVKDNGNGTLTVSPDNTSSLYSTYLAPLLPVTGTIKTILAVGVLVLGTITAIIIKRRKNTKSNRKIGN